LQAVGQIRSTADIPQNLKQCLKLIDDAAKGGAKALFLPEASDYIATSAVESIALSKSAETKLFLDGIKAAAKTSGIAVNVGIHEPTEDGKRVRNSLVWINDQGELEQSYQKIHMFDADISDGPKLRESE
jgi:predicted amidohydrolase